MSDLFSLKSQRHSHYTAQDIEILEGLEPVRRRPGMYVGGTDAQALHHMAAEIMDNAMDEAVAGYATEIHVELISQRILKIQDNGRGIPIDPHPKYPEKSALEVLMTTLHSGGKFSSKAYETAGGLHGVGLSVVNALSRDLTVEVRRDKILWCQHYKRGDPQGPLENLGVTSAASGTTITFDPDDEIFGPNPRFSPATVVGLIKTKAYLHKGVKIIWKCSSEACVSGDFTPLEATFYYPQGLEDLLKELSAETPALLSIPLTGHTAFKEAGGKVEWAITWTEDPLPCFQSYCNTIPTPLGGTHVTGFRQALGKALKAHAELVGHKKALSLSTEESLQGLMGVLSVFIKNPHFQGQTKEKLVTPGVTKQVESAIRDLLDHWFSQNPSETAQLLDLLVEKAEERRRLKHVKDIARQNATRRLRLPGKLADCSSPNLEETEIFLVEGDSAGGSAKQARDRKTQAVLPLRGKILNVAHASQDKLLANQQLLDLSKALGCAIGPACRLSDLRYGKIIIMTDADVDGAHIASLLMTYFFQQMRPLLEHGRLYLAQPPLYRLTHGTKSFYAQDDGHKDHLLKTHFSKTGSVEISRFKGLGEMPWTQLRDTTMAPKHRSLLRVRLSPHITQDLEQDSERALASLTQFVSDLMGRNAEKRYTYIQENARFAQGLDV